jgi:flagellar basal body rod protein FlgF
MTQTERLIEYVRSHPEASSLDITLACGIVNVTGRVSDARAQGVDIVCVRRFDGRQGYVVREPAAQLVLSL